MASLPNTNPHPDALRPYGLFQHQDVFVFGDGDDNVDVDAGSFD